MFMEKPPETRLEAVSAADVATGAATRVADSAGEILTREVTHLFEIRSGL